MGYETKLIVGLEGTWQDKDGGIYFQVFAELNMCKMGDSHVSKLNWQNKSPSTFWYHYANGMNQEIKITEDCYGDKSRPVPINFVIEALEKDVVEDNYARFKWALAFLKSIDTGEYKDISVMHYGY